MLTDGRLTAYAEAHADKNTIEEAAARLKLEVQYEELASEHLSPVLRLSENGLSLSGGGLTVRGDFARMLPRLRQDRLRGELLVRAAKIKGFSSENPLVVDATAGMAEDSLLLAACGFTVTLVEYNPMIAAMLSDALYRAAQIPELSAVVSRMKLIASDSLQVLTSLASPPDIVYLDPMFPERQKSALVKKKFQLLQQLEKPCTQETDLLQAAISAQPEKIIVKRPAKGPFLSGIKPSYSISGNGIRYDCIVL